MGSPTIEFALILHRLKFIDGMLRRLLRPCARAARVPSRIRKFSRASGLVDVMTPLRASPRRVVPRHAPRRRTLELFAAHYHLLQSLFFRRGPYTFFTFVMFSANSPGNFPNKIRVPTGRPSSYVRRRTRLHTFEAQMLSEVRQRSHALLGLRFQWYKDIQVF